MKKVLVTGAGGQLATALQEVVHTRGLEGYTFYTRDQFDIADPRQVEEMLTPQLDFCINCAAYTDVEGAEKYPEAAMRINATAVGLLAERCKDCGIILIHISTDYVFDGAKVGPYTPKDTPNPINAYGRSKLAGEVLISKILKRYFIIRTSWLYSGYGKNFYTTILNQARKGKDLYVTDVQKGCPTHARDLAEHIADLISSASENYGIHHFAGNRAMTWFDFAGKILSDNGLQGRVKVIRNNKSRSFAARRPVNSVLMSDNSPG